VGRAVTPRPRTGILADVPRRPSPRKRATGVQLGEASARAIILRAAGLVFAEHGVRAASVAQILAAAGVSRRTFYRFYQSKEHVMHALYVAGTGALLDGCRAAVREETDPERRVARCIDVHLRNARDLGRLVWVLGGEAQHHESSLHARRMEVFATVAEMFRETIPDADPLLYRALVLALDGVVRLMLEEADEGRRVTPAGCDRARRVMLRLATATMAAEDAAPPRRLTRSDGRAGSAAPR
jgi:AcrR family transcriptional regulator